MRVASVLRSCLCLGSVIAIVSICGLASAATIWNGPLISYTEPGTDPTDPADQDLLTTNVIITRDISAGIFNIAAEPFFSRGSSPAGTEWAVGTLDQYASLSYTDWTSVGNGHPVLTLVGQPLVCHLIADDIYLSVQFTYLGGHFAGGFAYNRSTPSVAQPPPTVSITDPADGAVFAAPATIHLVAEADAGDGTVTNVQFFGNGISLGSATAGPFTLTTSNLSSGSYALTAVATAAGITATSSVVNVSVVTPAVVKLGSGKISGGQFSFSYTANPGLTYIVQVSSNLVNWTTLATNVPSTSPVSITNAAAPAGRQFYRVGRLPNP
jgi:hypothetical protein